VSQLIDKYGSLTEAKLALDKVCKVARKGRKSQFQAIVEKLMTEIPQERPNSYYFIELLVKNLKIKI